MEERLDKTIHLIPCIWTDRFAVYHMYECDNYRACKPGAFPPYDAK